LLDLVTVAIDDPQALRRNATTAERKLAAGRSLRRRRTPRR
jgi:hypothetical protein